MTRMVVRREWRANVRDHALEQRLTEAGCPISLTVLLVSAAARNGPLTEWVRSQLEAGVMLRTSQAEHISRGMSVAETATRTGIEVRGVLYALTRLEADEQDIVDFHFAS